MRIAFLGCGFITQVHSRHLTSLAGDIVCSYASRDGAKAEDYRRRFGGETSYAGYAAAIADPRVDALVIAVAHEIAAERDADTLLRRVCDEHLFAHREVAVLGQVAGDELGRSRSHG